MNFPKLPKELMPFKGTMTQEKNILFKLLNNQKLTEIENLALEKVFSFNQELKFFFRNIEYKKLNKRDLKEFLNFINKIFYFTPHNTSPIEIKKLYRIVKNNSIMGSNKSITHTKFLTYPPDHIVKKNNMYNRANTPLTNVFYGSENIETAIFELKPSPGEKITVGEWVPKETNHFLLNFIFHEKVMPSKHRVSSIIKSKHDEHVEKMNPKLKKYFSTYMEILGYEFSKPVEHHLEYLVSAILAEKMFKVDSISKNVLDGIIYPSVNNNFSSHNVALKKNVIRHQFSLSRVTEFIISKTYYDSVWDGKLENGSTTKSLVEAYDKKEGKIIDNKIQW